MTPERLDALALAIETGTDMHFDKEELEWLVKAARERDALKEDTRTLIDEYNGMSAIATALKAENARLRAEIEDLMLECGYKPEFIEAALKTEDR